MRAIPAVKRVGRMNFDQMRIPVDASLAQIPSDATSVAVSNPRPKRKPIRYICQLRPIR
jgi:hypothetical protein